LRLILCVQCLNGVGWTSIVNASLGSQISLIHAHQDRGLIRPSQNRLHSFHHSLHRLWPVREVGQEHKDADQRQDVRCDFGQLFAVVVTGAVDGEQTGGVLIQSRNDSRRGDKASYSDIAS